MAKIKLTQIDLSKVVQIDTPIPEKVSIITLNDGTAFRAITYLSLGDALRYGIKVDVSTGNKPLVFDYKECTLTFYELTHD